MIQARSRSVLSFRWLMLAALASTACANEAPKPDEDGALRGTLIETIARYPDGHNDVSYSLRVDGDERNVRELVFEESPDILPNTEVKVWGERAGERILVSRYEIAPARRSGALGTLMQPIIDAEPLDPTSMAMVLVNTGAGVDLAVDEITEELFGTAPTSLKSYYLENSYGMHELTGQVMPEVYSYSMSGCDYQGLAGTLRDQVHEDAGVEEFDLYLWYFAQTDSCGWSGLSAGEDTFYNGSDGCVVLAQEPGHSFGLAHSSSLICESGGSVVPFLDDPQQCQHNEYGNRYDTMGGGCRHFSAYQKVYRTYLQQCNAVTVTSTGTFTLLPIERECDGIQVLQVPMPAVRPFDSEGGGGGDRTTDLAYYLVEFRAPIGFDEGMEPSVLINVAAEFRIFNPGSRNNRGEHIWLLDMAPEVESQGRGGGNGSAHALAVGQTFTDPAGGVSITTQSVSLDGAQIYVEIEGGTGEPTCLDGSTIVPPGSTVCADTTGGVGGVGGVGGMAGMAGSGGTGGSGGDATGGTGGSGGTAGTGETGGTSGASPGGSTGAGGTAGAGGTGGEPVGLAGSGGSAGGTVVPPPAESGTIEGGCACKVGAPTDKHGAGSWSFALAVAAFAASLRRRRARR